MKEGIDAYNQGAYDKALKLFIDAQLDHPDRPDILYNIGNAYYHTGDYEAAAKSYKEALKTENKLLQQKAHYNLGNADFRKKQYEDALKNYEDALKLNPDDIQARQNLEYVKKVMEQVKEQQNQQQQGDKNDKKDECEERRFRLRRTRQKKGRNRRRKRIRKNNPPKTRESSPGRMKRMPKMTSLHRISEMRPTRTKKAPMLRKYSRKRSGSAKTRRSERTRGFTIKACR